MIKLNKGFTLIELLVVIAIIGILAGVVLASLSSARSKGTDASVKSNLAGIRAQAEILYDNFAGYGVDSTPTAFAAASCTSTGLGADTLFADPKVAAQITAAGDASSGGGMAQGNCISTVSPAAWAVSVPLKETPANSWCVDSRGTSRAVTPSGGDRGFAAGGVAACK